MTQSTLQLSDAEWKQRLTPEQYRIAREHGTERAFTPGNFHDHKETGEYACVGCDAVLWRSDDKFDSGTGWPSFARPAAPGRIATADDFKLMYRRTEVHCATCGAHMGHLFEDGPKPDGLRYCVNGAVLEFHGGSDAE